VTRLKVWVGQREDEVEG